MQVPPDSGITIDRFEQADLRGVLDVILPIQQDEFGVAVTLDNQPDLLAIPEFYQTGKGDFWVARRHGTVVGTIGLKDIGSSQGALRKMFVSAPFRGREFRVSAHLLDRLLKEAARRAITDVFLGTTASFLAAHRFYEKNGFIEIAKDALPDTFPLMAVDTRFYAIRPADPRSGELA
ncbi:GNAT family N-acetyltransferase [Paraburkholderia sp. BCC1885]|uniref:GNAT family N-acetyltransferase n=1 Tax=Paraburkholderia sp. BCC1885 TaxID=2562669 RepID=UPI00118410DB|nr:GNAT family N-acetyltransferase [Paraburkholderia sp. BCC1885]